MTEKQKIARFACPFMKNVHGEADFCKREKCELWSSPEAGCSIRLGLVGIYRYFRLRVEGHV